MQFRASQPATRNRNRPEPLADHRAGTVTVTAAVTLALRPTGQRVDTSAQATASSSASAVPPGPAAVRPVMASVSDLARVADRLVAAPYETRATHTDSFEYTDVRVWETTDAAVNPAANTADAAVSVRRVRSWTNAGDSGRMYAVDEARGCPAEDKSWSNQEASPWGGPLSSDPDAVHRQLLGHPRTKASTCSAKSAGSTPTGSSRWPPAVA